MKTMTATTNEQLTGAIERLVEGKQRWGETSLAERIRHLELGLEGLRRVAPRWVELAARAKGLQPGSAVAGEEWFLGPVITARNLRLLIGTLRAGGRPEPNFRRRRIDGRTVVGVFPQGIWERLLWFGVSAELWLEPGKPETQGHCLNSEPRVGLVLGAGNVASIPATDVLYKLFAENQVVLLKMNPVNEYLGPIIEDAFYSLVKAGFLQVIYGGAEIGAAACRHPQVEAIHITGSDKTHDAIVWGGEKRDQALEKPVTSELGCVTPVVVVPGPWSDAQLRYQARHVAAMKVYNAGFNCVAAQVLVTSRNWHLRERFLALVDHELERAQARPAYYPGAEERLGKLCGALGVECSGPRLVRDVAHDSAALEEEAFCGLMAEVALDASDPAAFLAQATEFVNERVWGNLSATVLVHPETERAYELDLERALRDMRYGTVSVNIWSGVCFGLITPPWGAYPGNPPENIASGRGVVHNTLFFDHPEKTVVRGMFVTPYLPPWFTNNKCLEELGRQMFEFEMRPGLAPLLKTLWAVTRGTLLSR